jgi:branched-chain amino acid transport system permease protein
MIIGAYVSAYLVKAMGWPFGAALVVAVLLGALIAFILSFGFARVPGFACGIGTIALLFIAQAIVRSIEAIGAIHGYFGIPMLDYIFPLSLISLAVIGFLIYNLVHSRVGRAIEVVNTDINLAKISGINIYKLRMALQTASGAIGALAGVIYAFTMGMIHVQNIGIALLLEIIVFFFVGGSSTMWGILIFAPILYSLHVFLPSSIAMFTDLIFGILLIVVMMLRPDGIIVKDMFKGIRLKLQK